MIGILGGTFDPVHYGHLKPAHDVKNALSLDEIRFIPNKNPPHRESPWLSATQRVALLKLALSEYPGFVLDKREINRSGKSYMVDTLHSLRNDFPEQHLCLILGVDAIAGLKRWYQWEKILTMCHIVVTQRPGYLWGESSATQGFERFLTEDVSDLKREETGRILLQLVTPVDLSASEIRQYLKNGQNISHMVPPAVQQQLMKMMQTEYIEAVDDNR